MLLADSISSGYGDLTIVESMSLAVARGEIVAIVGHNGCGKSTALWSIAGLTWSRGKRIELDGVSLLGMPAWRRAENGCAIALQDGGVFADLSVADNLGLADKDAARLFENAPASLRELFRSILTRAVARAGSLSGGEQRVLTLALACARQPKLLLADEPSLGLAPETASAVFEFLGVLSGAGKAGILLVTHERNAVLEYAERVYVMAQGRIVAVLDRQQIQQHPELLDKAYAGSFGAALGT